MGFKRAVAAIGAAARAVGGAAVTVTAANAAPALAAYVPVSQIIVTADAAPKKNGLSETGGELSAGLPIVGLGLVALGGALLLARRFERRMVRG